METQNKQKTIIISFHCWVPSSSPWKIRVGERRQKLHLHRQGSDSLSNSRVPENNHEGKVKLSKLLPAVVKR